MGDESSLHMNEELRELLSDDNFSDEEHEVNAIPDHSFLKKTNLAQLYILQKNHFDSNLSNFISTGFLSH